jgi:hypothetical protein
MSCGKSVKVVAREEVAVRILEVTEAMFIVRWDVQHLSQVVIVGSRSEQRSVDLKKARRMI